METNDAFEKSQNLNLDSDAARSEADTDLYNKILSALHTNSLINSEKISVRVKEHRVYLEGTVGSENERTLAAACIADIFGISTISNSITFPFDSRH